MMAGFLEYVPGDSFIHKMNPVAKVICAFLISISCFCTTNIVFLALILVLDAVLAASCKMVKPALGLAKVVGIFSIVLVLIALLTSSSGTMLVELPWGYIGTGSIYSAILIVVRLIGCAIPLFLVMYVTQLTDMSNAFCANLHVPYKYAFTFTSSIHFIPVFMNDMSAIMEAQTARGVAFDGSFAKRIRLMIPLCVPLLISSVRKTNSAAIAAEVRGFDLRTSQSGYKRYPFSGTDVLCMVACAALIGISIASNYLMPFAIWL